MMDTIGIPIPEFDDIVIFSFQEHFDIFYERKAINVDIIFWDVTTGYHQTMRVNGENAEKIRDFLLNQLFVKQDSDGLADLLRKELSK